MIILFLILAFVSVYHLQVSSYHEDYITPRSTNAVKGIFAVIILYSHMRGYLTLNRTMLDYGYAFILDGFGQLMVAPFLFYSGFGIMESVKKKRDYEKTFFKKRICKTLLHFDIAVLLFFVLQLILGNRFPWGTFLLSLTGWASLGNSNWFIFDILALYCISFPIIKSKKLSEEKMGWLVLLLTIILWLLVYQSKSGQWWWYDTLLTYPLGFFYSIYREKIEPCLKNQTTYFFVAFTLFILFCIWRYIFGTDIYGICACLFSLLLIIVTMKVKFNNSILQWLGTLAFAIYIMQRWPMIILSHFGINQNKWLFVVIAIPSVLAIALLYKKILDLIDNRYFN